MFARLLWLGHAYELLFRAESSTNAALIGQLALTFTSAYMMRQMNSDSVRGMAARSSVEMRMRDCVGFLQRARNRKFVPISQAAKAIVFFASGVSSGVWIAERKARRVVGRQYGLTLLQEMVKCRPPPPFQEQDRSIICSVGFDQTYAKAGAGTGVSAYNPLQRVDATGKKHGVERMVYINGQFLPAPRSATTLSADAIARIRSTGPYTQDFRRILPLLQPYRLDGIMDRYVRLTVGLLMGQPPPSTRAAIVQLLSRPNDDPGEASYITYMPPLFNVNTQSYVDMIAIIAWCVSFFSLTPLILHLIGDGQSVLRLRDLKRIHTSRYKHVLIGNGHFHSGAHSAFADVTLWWDCMLFTCLNAIGKVTLTRDGELSGTVKPSIKSLQSNATEHTQQSLLAVTVAIIVFFVTKVKQPPPELFLSNPVVYMSQIQNAGGIVLYQFLRHSGVPTLMWQRATRGRDGKTLDDLHCLALHKFRCAHKTSSSQISLLHLISIFGTHPELRTYLRSRLFVSLTTNIGSAIGTDRSLECMNDMQKEVNVGPSLVQSLSHTLLIQPMQYVYRHWKIYMGSLSGSSTGIRVTMVNEVDVLVKLFEQKVGTDLQTFTAHSYLWHTGNGVKMRASSNLKKGRPWEWIWSVARGLSSCLKKTPITGGDGPKSSTETWVHWVERHIADHMFYQ